MTLLPCAPLATQAFARTHPPQRACGRGAKDVAAERRASSVLQALGTLEEAVQGLQGARQRAVLTADVLRVEHVVLDGHR